MAGITEIQTALLVFVKKEIVAEHVEMTADTLLKDAGIDSFSVIELVLFLERTFNVHLQESDLIPENFKNIRALAQCAATYQ